MQKKGGEIKKLNQLKCSREYLEHNGGIWLASGGNVALAMVVGMVVERREIEVRKKEEEGGKKKKLVCDSHICVLWIGNPSVN